MPHASMPVGCHNRYIVHSQVLYYHTSGTHDTRVRDFWYTRVGYLVHACIKPNVTGRVPCTRVSTYMHNRAFVTLPLGGTIQL